ncbi:hypothetical protein [Clostridium sp. YIM B02569]|uniref:hypothetical protein n=1 Tax=Clostridium sp. YIM B02569 TaxID=2911967 RepID=UPI001EEF388E|nr:hypothetical protein [Clostridium sp. YIM B02569]
MFKRPSFSNGKLKAIQCIWWAVSLLIAMVLKDNLDLKLWEYLCIAVPLILSGDALIRKFIKGKI